MRKRREGIERKKRGNKEEVRGRKRGEGRAGIEFVTLVIFQNINNCN